MSTRLSGGGAIHQRDVITPKLINNIIRDDRPRITPVVKSCKGVPGYGLSPSSTNRPQQFSREKMVTNM